MPSFKSALRHVSAKELSKATKIPLRTIYHWMRGERVPNAWVQTQVKMALVELAKKKPLDRKRAN